MNCSDEYLIQSGGEELRASEDKREELEQKVGGKEEKSEIRQPII